MKKLILLSSLLFTVIIVGCFSTKIVHIPYYAKNIDVYENSIEYYDGVKIKKCKLADTVTLNGYKCVSWLHFFESGKIKQLQTAKDIAMSYYVIPANSTIFFNNANENKIKYIWFGQDVKIRGIECNGGGKISTEFYDNDSLKACFLSKSQNIQGFSCKSSLFDPVYFYPNGKIKILTLGADSKFNNIIYKKGTSIIVKEDGTVARFNR